MRTKYLQCFTWILIRICVCGGEANLRYSASGVQLLQQKVDRVDARTKAKSAGANRSATSKLARVGDSTPGGLTKNADGRTAIQIFEDAGLLDAADISSYPPLPRAGMEQQGSQGVHIAAQDRIRDAQIAMENAQLRTENADMRREEAELRIEEKQVRAEDAQLRLEDENLRREDDNLRRSLQAASSQATLAHRSVDAILEESSIVAAHKSKSFVLSVSAVALIAVPFCLCCCFPRKHHPEHEDPEKDGWQSGLGAKRNLGRPGGADANQNLKELLDGKKEDEEWVCSWCYKRKTIVYFFAVVVVVSVLLGAVLWQCGILQPLLAQFFLYFYVVLFLIGFATLLMWQAWGKLRGLVQYIVGQIGVIDQITNPGKMFRRQAKDKWSTMLDDGGFNQQANSAFDGVLKRGAKEKTTSMPTDFLHDGGIHRVASKAHSPVSAATDNIQFAFPKRRATPSL